MDDKEWYEKKWIAHINELTGKTYYTVNDEQDKKEDITMSKKFTEEQYHKIVNAWDNEGLYRTATQAVIDTLPVSHMGKQALAIANPLTREWAHEQFVEEEKKYVWYLKNNKRYSLTNHGGSTQVNIVTTSESSLTESEIREWGYNPEMFDKEEVD